MRGVKEELWKREQMKQMIEQNGRGLGGEKHLKSLPISLTPAESIGRSQLSPFSDMIYVRTKTLY